MPITSDHFEDAIPCPWPRYLGLVMMGMPLYGFGMLIFSLLEWEQRLAWTGAG